MFRSPEAPSSFPHFCRRPLYVKFRELYCYSPSTPLPVAEDEISFFNAFLPLGCQWHEDEVGCQHFCVVQCVERCGPNSQESSLSVKTTRLERDIRPIADPRRQAMPRTQYHMMSSSLDWYVDLHLISFVA